MSPSSSAPSSTTTTTAAAANVFDVGKYSTVLLSVEPKTCCTTTSSSSPSDPPPKPLLIAKRSDAGEFALLQLLHGCLLSNSFYSQLIQHIASHGFIVVAPQPPSTQWRPVPLGPIPALHSLSMALISVTIFTGILFSAAEIRDTRWLWRRSKTPFQWLLCFPHSNGACFPFMIFIPLGNLRSKIIGGSGAIMFSYSVIYNMRNLINQFQYDEYIWAAVSLYPNIVKRFLAMFKASGGNSGTEN